jgi:hypothetical protein
MLNISYCSLIIVASLQISGAFSFGSSNSRRAFVETLTTASIVFAAQPVLAADDLKIGGSVKFAGEEIMSPKEHGTSSVPVQENLRYGVSRKQADKICNFNRHFAESAGSFRETSFEDTVRKANGPVTFYDSNSGKPLFVAPIGRSVDEFIEESMYHGWPSFRDQEVVWDNVRVLKSSGETVSVDGTHLGRKYPCDRDS